MISGNLQPDAGAVYLDGINLAKLNRRQEKQLKYTFGWVPQESQLVRSATVFENLCPPGRFGRMGGAMTDGPLITKALGLVGMAGRRSSQPAMPTRTSALGIRGPAVMAPPLPPDRPWGHRFSNTVARRTRRDA